MPIATTIKQLPNTDTLSETDLFLVSVGGTTKNISWGQVKAMIEGRKETMPEFHSMPTNIWTIAHITNTTTYATNMYTTWITNDLSRPSSQKVTETIASVVPKPVFPILTTGQRWMISFGMIISLVCIIRIMASLKWNK